MNSYSQGIMALLPGTTPLNNMTPGRYRLEVLDNNDHVTKTFDVVVEDGKQRDYDV